MDFGANLSIIIPNYRERRLMEVYAYFRRFYPEAQIILADDLEGKGKGWAMREGLKQATGELVCFLDGDMDIMPQEIKKLLRAVKNYDAVVGRRKYQASWPRKTLSWGYHLLIMFLFGLNLDTQSGLKLFRREVLPTWKTNSFAFDCEILAQMRQKGCLMREAPIKSVIYQSVSIRAVWKTFKETVKVWWRLK